MTRAAIYCRVSIGRQENENQLVQLREFAAKQGWEIVREYTDTAGGGKTDRDGLKAMWDGAFKREFDLLLFWALDRLSREGVLGTLRYLERLTSYGVAYRSQSSTSIALASSVTRLRSTSHGDSMLFTRPRAWHRSQN